MRKNNSQLLIDKLNVRIRDLHAHADLYNKDIVGVAISDNDEHQTDLQKLREEFIEIFGKFIVVGSADNLDGQYIYLKI